MATSIAVIADPACRGLLHDLLSEEGYAAARLRGKVKR
jgi:hypothetical protein